MSNSQISDPPVISFSGFPELGDYFQLGMASLFTGNWSTSDPLTGLMAGIEAPAFVSRFDGGPSLAYWLDDLLTVETISSPSNTRVALQVSKGKASVAIDANEGLHALVVDSTYQLWHYYYIYGDLTPIKLSDGPICHVVAAAGEENTCHVLYSTFSEDSNADGTLDEGEDINGNAVLDATPKQLIYQSVDASSPSTMELIDADTLFKVCAFDLHFSADHGLKLAYANVSASEIRFAERNASNWSSIKASSVPDMFQSVALAVNSAGECAITYAGSDRRRLYVAEEAGGAFSETLISQVSQGDYFSGTDVVYDESDQLAVLSSEKDRVYLNLYTRSAVPYLLNTSVRPTGIRPAFIVTWPTPSENTTKQVLQSSNNLSDPDSWEFVAERRVNAYSEVIETTVENDGPMRFYRVIELNE